MASDTIQVSTLDQLDAAIGFVDAQTSGSYTIELTGDIAAGTSPDVGTQLTDPQGHAEAVNGRPVISTTSRARTSVFRPQIPPSVASR